MTRNMHHDTPAPALRGVTLEVDDRGNLTGWTAHEHELELEELEERPRNPLTIGGIVGRLLEAADRLERLAPERVDGLHAAHDRLDALALRNIAAELTAHGNLRRPTPYAPGD